MSHDPTPIRAPDTGHAMMSASGSERWEHCPGSLAMEHGLPDSASEFADEGTAAHTLATLVFADPARDAAAFIGRTIDVCNRDGTVRRSYVVDDDMARHVGHFVAESLKATGDGQLFVEQRVPLTHITEEVDATGQSDVIAVLDDGDEIMVRDLKYGMGVKVALRDENGKLNSQFTMYASGALKRFDGVLGTAKRVRLAVHQPRLGHLDEIVVTLDELQQRVAELRKAADTALTAFTFRDNWLGKDESYLVPGDQQCRWCKAKANCPALARLVRETIGADFSPVDSINPSDLVTPDIPADTLSQKMQRVDLIEDWCKAVRAQVEYRLTNGQDVPFFKLVMGKRGNRKWGDEELAESELKRMRLKSDDMYDRKLKSPTSIEKLLKDDAPKKWAKLAPLITQNPGKLHVAPIDDPREAVSVESTAADFAPVSQDFSDLG